MNVCKYLLMLVIACSLVACKVKPVDYTGQWVSIMPTETLNEWVLDGDRSLFELDGDTLLLLGRASLYYYGKVHKAWFRNFELVAQIKTEPGAVAALWFHSGNESGYQALIGNTTTSEERRKTGSLSGVRNLFKSMATDNEWFTMRVRVVGKHVTISVNDVLVVDYLEPDEPYRTEENSGMRFSQGTFAFSNYTSNVVKIKTLDLMPLSDEEMPERTEAVSEQNCDIIRLQQDNFPLIDYHVHLKGWNQEQAMENSRRYGIFYGIAPNCGIGFPVTSDEDIFIYLDTTKNLSSFQAMQAEGREWLSIFSQEAYSHFDYIFTDALTFNDHRGRRTRLWIPEEVFIDIPMENYMDMIVDRTVQILMNEPVDIYVNPTFLPEQMSPYYDELWTDERIEKVIRALLTRGIAMEINARYRIPSERIIRAAKEAGVRFAFGTNNEDADMGKLEYCIEMMERCDITRHDIFFPVLKATPNNTLNNIYN